MDYKDTQRYTQGRVDTNLGILFLSYRQMLTSHVIQLNVAWRSGNCLCVRFE